MRHIWCPACGCDVSRQVKAGIVVYLERLAAQGGHARAATLSPERRSDIARGAAKSRWARVAQARQAR